MGSMRPFVRTIPMAVPSRTPAGEAQTLLLFAGQHLGKPTRVCKTVIGLRPMQTAAGIALAVVGVAFSANVLSTLLGRYGPQNRPFNMFIGGVLSVGAFWGSLWLWNPIPVLVLVVTFTAATVTAGKFFARHDADWGVPTGPIEIRVRQRNSLAVGLAAGIVVALIVDAID